MREVMRGTDAAHAEQPPQPDPAPAEHAAAPTAAPLPAADVTQLESEARYHRDRLALYNAKALTARPTSAAELRRLERVSATADERLAHAKSS